MRLRVSLQEFSRFSFPVLFYVVGVLLFETPSYIQAQKREYMPYSTNPLDYFKSWGNFVYSFNCIVNVFLVKASLKNASKARLSKTFKRTVYFLLFFYCFISLSGYLSLGTDALNEDLIILRKPLEGSNDYLMKVAILCNITRCLLPGSNRFYYPCHPHQVSVHRIFQFRRHTSP